MRHHALGSAVVLVLALASVGFGQDAGRAGQDAGQGGPGNSGAGGQRGARGAAAAAPAPPAKPTPRKADGKPVLGRMAGENALWLPAGGGGERFVNA
ncbi:MAG TPA: hypothetical protein VMB70_13820, partial [Terriglobia bacterium]|nr:hypothetical protein [Terriglobia bacterium]